MAYNKVLFPNKSIAIDLTQDTVTEDTLSIGVTAHNKYGEQIVGTATFGIDESQLQENEIITPTDEERKYLPAEGYGGFKQVTVLPVQAEVLTVRANGYFTRPEGKFFSAVNVKTSEGITTTNLTIDPKLEKQTIRPTQYGADAFNEITVNPYTLKLEDLKITNTANGIYKPSLNVDGFKSVTVDFGNTNTNTVKELNVTPTLEEQIFLPQNDNVSAYNKVTVGATNLKEIEIFPQQIDSQYNTNNDDDGSLGYKNVIVKAVDSSIDPNIKPENIKANIKILDIVGNYIPSIEDVDLSATTLPAKYALAGYNYYNSKGKLTSGEMKIYSGEFEEID